MQRARLAAPLIVLGLLLIELGLPMVGVESPVLGWILIGTAVALLLAAMGLFMWDVKAPAARSDTREALWLPSSLRRARKVGSATKWGILLVTVWYLMILAAPVFLTLGILFWSTGTTVSIIGFVSAGVLASTYVAERFKYIFWVQANE